MRTSQTRTGFPITMASLAALLFGSLAAVPSGVVYAQTADDEELEEVVVVGTRQIIQSAIEIKRNSVEIVDGLSADDIGDLPALSIGEALETVTGVMSHRENGGATEVAIRGLGPFLSHTTFNGRDVTNGDGDRAINFSQFPSELMNKLMIYKTQDASLVEGGVAGLIWLETLKPLDYNQTRFQANIKGNWNPDHGNIDDTMEDELGYRATLSYIDQFDLGNGGRIGFSLGYQGFKSTAPESEVRSSSPSGTSRYACINEPNVLWEGYYGSSSDDCEDQVSDAPYDPDGDGDFQEDNQGYITAVNPDTGEAYSDGLAWAFAPSSRGYRQNDTSDDRDAFFGAFQFQPNDQWDINLDVQWSERTRQEFRNDLNFANQKRQTVGVTGPSLVVSDTGAVSTWAGRTAIESNSTYWDRTEEYLGGGLAVEFHATDRLTVSVDASFSETERYDRELQLRMQSDDDDIFNVDTPARVAGGSGWGYQPMVMWNMDSGIPQYTIYDFDVTDPTLFSDRYRVRIDTDADTRNTITALRGDFELSELAWDSFTSLEGGFRISEMEFFSPEPARWELEELRDNNATELAAIPVINEACRDSSFPESDFLSNVASGNLVTVLDSSSGLPISGTGSTWATFDPVCVANAIIDQFHQGDERYPNGQIAYPSLVEEAPGTIDVTETTLAAYLKANFEFQLGDYPVYGNFGLRYVNTEVESVGYRQAYEIIADDEGFLTMQPVAGADLLRVAVEDDYTELLPSFSAVMELDEDLLFRAGIFRGLSRPEYKALGYERDFQLSGEEDITDPDALIDEVEGSGNPFTQPLPSWNIDTAIEWYPDADTILALGVYYKKFTGGFEQTRSTESFIVDGRPVSAPFTTSETNEDESELYGFEITGAYRFSQLPGVFGGIGAKVSYNYADSDFQFEDSQYGKVVIPNEDGTVFSETRRIIAPANVPGFSEHVLSAQGYWEIGDFDLQLIYKYRSEYFQPYLSNGTRIRYIGDTEVWEARMSYQLNKNVRFTLEGINLFDEEKKQYFFTDDDLGEVNSYGPRVFFGVRVKYW